jgi:hypothetical protein
LELPFPGISAFIAVATPVPKAHSDFEERIKFMDAKMDRKCEELILRKLYDLPGREAILLPTMFNPPIMLSNIHRLGGEMKKKGYTTNPDRRMGGWHMRLLPPGVDACEGAKPSAPPLTSAVL